jgi:hypothetical protein
MFDWKDFADGTVLQLRCLRCKREHEPAARPYVSRGRAGCANCGHVPPVFTSRLAYRDHLLATTSVAALPAGGR